MDNKEIKRIIIEEVKPYLDTKNGTPWQTPSNKKLLKRLNNKYNNWFQGIGELLYLVKNIDLIETMILYCPVCGNKNPYFKNHYQHHCCQKCAANDPEVRKQIENTSYLHCGYKCNFASPNKKLNGRATMKEKTGYESYAQIPGWKEECQKRAINRTPEQKLAIKLKAEKSYYERYGCRHNWASKDPKLNGCATRKQKYNVDYMMSNPKYKAISVQTRKNDIDENGLNSYERGGLKAIETSLNNIDKNGLNSYQRGIIKSENTTQIRYGKKHYTQTQKFKDLFKDKEWVEKRNKKHYETLIKNNTYKKPSKPEDKVYNILIDKFGINNICRPFRNQLYPFKCDFYIKSLDLFIECHFSQYHQGKPFDINRKQDWIKLLCLELNAVKMIRQKGRAVENQYENMIYTWTDLDVRKLETFKKNNLNYKIFYTEKEFNKWFQNL